MGRVTDKEEVNNYSQLSSAILVVCFMQSLSPSGIDRVIEMAWEDRTPFEAILFQFNLSEGEVITLMRQQLKPSSFKRWRRRVQGRTTKHLFQRSAEVNRFKCSRQRVITGNKISKKKY